MIFLCPFFLLTLLFQISFLNFILPLEIPVNAFNQKTNFIQRSAPFQKAWPPRLLEENLLDQIPISIHGKLSEVYEHVIDELLVFHVHQP